MSSSSERSEGDRSPGSDAAAALEAMLLRRLSDFSRRVPRLTDEHEQCERIRAAIREGGLQPILCGRVERRTMTFAEVFQRRYGEPP